MREKQPRRMLTPNTVRAVDRDLLWAAQEYGILDLVGAEGVETDELFKDPTEPKPYKLAKDAVLKNLLSRRFLKENNGKLTFNPHYPELLPGASFRRYIIDLRNWYEIVYKAPQQLRQGEVPKLEQRAYDGIVEISEKLAEKLVDPIREDFPQIATDSLEALDLASGKLHVLRTFAKMNPSLSVTAIEQNPRFIEFLHNTLIQEGLSQRVKVINGDVRKDSHILADHQFDFIFASHIIHWLTPQETLDIFGQVRRLLKKGGGFFINEDYLSDNKLAPLDSVGKHARMSVQGYQVFSRGEIVSMLAEKGFPYPKVRKLDSRRVLFESFV